MKLQRKIYIVQLGTLLALKGINTPELLPRPYTTLCNYVATYSLELVISLSNKREKIYSM